jgi:hypothetical protein
MVRPKLDDDVSFLQRLMSPVVEPAGAATSPALAQRLDEPKNRLLEIIAVAGRAISFLLAGSHFRQLLENLTLKAIVGLALRLDDLVAVGLLSKATPKFEATFRVGDGIFDTCG